MILIISDSEMLRIVTMWTDKGSLSDRLNGIRNTDISSRFFLPPLISNPYISIPDRWAPGQLRTILSLNSQLRTILSSQLRVILNSNSQVRMIFIIGALLQTILNKALLRVILILNSLLQMILNKGFSTGFPQAGSLSKHYHAHF
jgi:hypothetical protein